jgi:septum formation protein
LVAKTSVWFRRLCSEWIDGYLRTKEPLDKAGAYAIQGKAAMMVNAIQGSYTNVVGLPLAQTLELLERAGLWRPFFPDQPAQGGSP